MNKKAAFLVCAALCIAGFGVTQWLIFYKAPLDRLLFFNQKIFYYHVANAMLLFLAVILCGVYSLLYLRKRRGEHDDVAQSWGEIAVLMGAIALTTGSIWGKVAWGHWWVWDARLTTTLLLWLTMVGYVLVRQYGGPGSERMAAGLAVFGVVNIPLVYFSVKLWRGLHPQTSVVPGLTGEMRLAMWSCVALFLVFYSLVAVVRRQAATAERRLGEMREMALDAGLIE